MLLNMSSQKLFVVAIDFGTTYSGYAFSNISDKDQIYTYSWNQGIYHSAKTPTSILFSPLKEFDSFGYGAEEKYAALSQQKRNKDWFFFKRFKLTLYTNKNLRENTSIRDYTGKEMPAIDVFSGGIRYLKDHLFRNFQERITLWRDHDIHWVLTVPSIWDEAAKKLMRKAAEKAGIPGTQLTLALEPESAALYCQSGQDRTGLSPLKPGDMFLIVDCGGGTVDVTAHKVRNDKSLKEIHRASGGPWGGIKVDDAFYEYLLNLFGFHIISSLPKSDVIELDTSFESLKKSVRLSNDMVYMQIPYSLRRYAPTARLFAGKLKLEASKVKSFFDISVQKICDHIRKLMSASSMDSVQTILLVGGLSESKLIHYEIQRNFNTMNVCVPNEPELAVLKGAVLFGHNPEKIRFRMSPFTYGVDTVDSFCHGVHPVHKLRIYDGKEYCIDIFDIHVKINQKVESGQTISEVTYEPLYAGQTEISFQVVTSKSRNPVFVTDKNSKIIGNFKIQLPATAFKPSVDVKMIFSGTELTVEARNNITNQLYYSSFEFE